MTSSEMSQKQVCERIGSEFVPALPHFKVGLAMASLAGAPIYGVRLAQTSDTTGWYIWGGPHLADPDFFQSVHTTHMEQFCPFAVKYLGLAPGYKFIIDQDGYEDVWFDGISSGDIS